MLLITQSQQFSMLKHPHEYPMDNLLAPFTASSVLHQGLLLISLDGPWLPWLSELLVITRAWECWNMSE